MNRHVAVAAVELLLGLGAARAFDSEAPDAGEMKSYPWPETVLGDPPEGGIRY